MEQEALQQLLEKISDGTATDREIAIYNNYCIAAEKAAIAAGTVLPDEESVEKQMHDNIRRRIAGKQQPFLIRYWYLSAAALTGIIITCFSLYKPATHKFMAAAKHVAHDIPAGGDKAVLTLSNGQQISLSDAASGDIARQTGLRIYKTATGEIVYEATGGTNKADTGFNKIATPRGGQYRIVLQDGSKVWLNAASSLSYPATFAAGERKVQLDGEAYFEIAKDANRPFKVSTTTQTVEVLGTHFNINAYNDNAQERTTLLEGSVSITTAAAARSLLQPGEQCSINNQTGAQQKSKANAEETIAWKNGYFVFNDTYLSEVMLQLSRWYDVRVDPATIPKIRYNGIIPRNEPLSKVLEMLEFTGGLKFYIDERTIKVK
ncbi:FecR domain-containing protein [Chitinophaga sp. MM2321]|uniref:FecR family protein n=1 Tax=Chitinophaga sp. MM2321 TaxID=3137178 RepID=UPI0032D590D4